MKKAYLLILLLLAGCKKAPPIVPEIDKELSTIILSDERTVKSLGAETNQKILIASRFMGYHERRNRTELRKFLGIDPARIDWCAAFVNSVLHEMGKKGSESVSEYPLTARSFLRWGKRVREPEVGDIVVFPRGTEDWQGHVGFYYGTEYVNGVKFYQILGGNQNDAVTIQLFRASFAISIRREKK
jgi:uncharacterized protein (TIGR02594 family)